MHTEKKPSRFRPFFLIFLLLGLCLSFSMTSRAAVSIRNIRTVSGGHFEKLKANWIYRYEDGTIAKNCLLSIDGKTYYFSPRGLRMYGKRKIGNSYYYFGARSEGYMYKSRWVKDSSGNYFRLKSNGKMATGWLTWHGKKYYLLSKNGYRLYGWHNIGGKRLYFGTREEGYLYCNTLLTYKNSIYYLQEDGTRATGWQTIDGDTYYFSKQGKAYKGRHTIDGKTCTFSSTGKLIHSGPLMSLSSECAILINADTGEVIYEKYADRKHANASTTKILTCILALEKCRLTETVTISANAASQEPSKLYMTAGDSFYLKDLLYSLMLPSHNDTAVAIAEHISGSTTKFASLMNKKAKALGCTRTNFVTPNGLDNYNGQSYNHYTTARDMAIIARYAWKNSTFRKIVGTTSYGFQSRQGRSYWVTTTNSLLNTLDGVKGMKTGYTSQAGYCFVGVIEASDGTEYISVTLGASTNTARWSDNQKLLQYAYNLS